MQPTRMAAAALLLAAGGHACAGTVQQTAGGIEVRPDGGPARLVRLELMAGNIVHVVKLDREGERLTPSLMTVAQPCADMDAAGKTVTYDGKPVTVTP